MSLNINFEIVDNLKLKTSNKKSYLLRFNYTPSLVKEVSEYHKRYFIKDLKAWELPCDDYSLNFIKELIRKYDSISYNKLFGSSLDIVVSEQKQKEIDSITLPNIDSKIKLFKHQEDTIKFGILRNSFLLGDEMGLGKTAAVIHYAIYKKTSSYYKHCLVITGINGLKYNWYKEVSIHSNESSYILGMRELKRKQGYKIGNSNDILKDLEYIDNLPYFIITNIETLRNTQIASKLVKLVEYNKIQMVVMDEAQAIKNPQSQQGSAFLRLRAKTKVAMTGTPIMNNPVELYPIFNWLDIDKHSYYQFKQHYCIFGGYGNYEIVGYKHLEDIQEKLDKVMLRRLKKDVLDLPDKLYKTEYLEMTKEQERLYKEVKTDILSQIDLIKSVPNPLVSLLRLRQVTGNPQLLASDAQISPKFIRLLELAKELKENNEKFIVFSNWSSMIKSAYDMLSKYMKCEIITGETPQNDRMGIIDNFTNNSHCILGTVGALGTGFNLTAATTIIFLDSPWNRATKVQAEDRAYRIGTKSNVSIITLVCKDSIDERIEEIIYKKGIMSDVIVDMKVDLHQNKSAIVDFLLS